MKRTALAALIALLSLSAHAQSSGQLELSIRFYDKAIYFSDSTVQIMLEFYNDTPSPARFKIAGNRFYSLDFDVLSISNVPATRSMSFTVARATDTPVFYREISLEPGERFGFVETLNDFVKLPAPGIHVIRAYFYPELFRSIASSRIASNQLTLTVHPGASERADEVMIDVETGEILARAALPPDEVVAYLLSARQREQWEKFLLYLNLERLYTRVPANAAQYRRLSDEERRRTLRIFRDELTSETTEDDILLIPTAFQIAKTTYTDNEATVLVIERFAHTSFTEVKEYTYYLSRTDRVWTVYGYAVRNLGTE